MLQAFIDCAWLARILSKYALNGKKYLYDIDVNLLRTTTHLPTLLPPSNK
jgi:hypothetical protein